MIVTYVEELGMLRAVVGEVLEETLRDLQWFSFDGWLDIHRDELLSGSQRSLVTGTTIAPLQSSDNFPKSVGSSVAPWSPK